MIETREQVSYICRIDYVRRMHSVMDRQLIDSLAEPPLVNQRLQAGYLTAYVHAAFDLFVFHFFGLLSPFSILIGFSSLFAAVTIADLVFIYTTASVFAEGVAAEADVRDMAPTEKIVTADRIPARILVLIPFVFFIVVTPFVDVVLVVFLLMDLKLNKFFMVISPFI
jgi:hypothetical protein